MKPILLFSRLLLFLLCMTTWLYGQNSKTVYGNFVYQNEVYQYQCEKNSSAIYRFSISTLEPPNVWSGFKEADIDSALEFVSGIPPEVASTDLLVAVLGSI